MGTDGTIGKMAIDGGRAQVLAAALPPPTAVTLSGSYVLWVSEGVWADTGTTLPGTGSLYRLAK